MSRPKVPIRGRGHVWLYIPIPHHRMLVEEPFEHSVATPTTTAPGGEA